MNDPCKEGCRHHEALKDRVQRLGVDVAKNCQAVKKSVNLTLFLWVIAALLGFVGYSFIYIYQVEAEYDGKLETHKESANMQWSLIRERIGDIDRRDAVDSSLIKKSNDQILETLKAIRYTQEQILKEIGGHERRLSIMEDRISR